MLLGLGSDGHTASLFPGNPALRETNRWAVGIDQAGLAPFVPRVSFTFTALTSTRQMVFVVNGKDKRDMVKLVLSGADLPATRARTSHRCFGCWIAQLLRIPIRSRANLFSSGKPSPITELIVGSSSSPISGCKTVGEIDYCAGQPFAVGLVAHNCRLNIDRNFDAVGK